MMPFACRLARWLACVVLLSVAGTAAAVPFSLMVFNIEYGGERVDFNQVIAAIRAADPDVVFLEEADLNTGKVSQALGGTHPYFDSGMQIVSRYPLYEPSGSKKAYTLAEIRPGQVVVLANAHLDSVRYGPFRMQKGASAQWLEENERVTRLSNVRHHLQVLPPLAAQGYPVFLGGDFNSPSHLDYTPQNVAVMAAVRGAGKVFEFVWPVSKAFHDAGFRDSYRDVHPDPVAKPGLTWWADKPWRPGGYYPKTVVQDRIDFIYSAGPATPLDSLVVGEPGADADIVIDPWVSDHRALVSSFDVTPQAMPVMVSVDQRFLRQGEPLSVTAQSAALSDRRYDVALVRRDAPVGRAIVRKALQVPFDRLGFGSYKLEPGEYEAVLVDDQDVEYGRKGFSVLARDAGFQMKTDKLSYRVGEPVKVSFRNGFGIKWPYIEIVRKGGGYERYSYASHDYFANPFTEAGTLVNPVHDTLTITDRLPRGDYEITYYYSDAVFVARTAFRVR